MYIVMRRWANGAAIASKTKEREAEVREILQGVPGFIAYFGVQDGDSVTTITVCRDRDGTQESTRRAREWAQKNLGDAGLSAPEVVEGETYLHF